MNISKVVLNIVGIVFWIALCFSAVFILAPALVSAKSTLAVIAGFSIVVAVVIANIAMAASFIKSYFTNSNNSSKES